MADYSDFSCTETHFSKIILPYLSQIFYQAHSNRIVYNKGDAMENVISSKSFNLLDENWIPVKYETEEIRDISITTALKDAEIIKDLEAPQFREDTVHFYYMLPIRLIATIIESAYFKKETCYAAANRDYVNTLYNDGLYTDVVKRYLEKYHDRFDLFAEKHPFLQNVGLRNKLNAALAKGDKTFLSWNPLAPNAASLLYGKYRSFNDPEAKNVMDHYRMYEKELAFFILYLATCGTSPMPAQYSEASLEKNISVYTALKGKNLKETILANIIDLSTSSQPTADEEDIKPDMPIWEMNSVHEIEEYSPEEVSGNLLCRMYYPGISMLASEPDENGLIKSMVRVKTASKRKGSSTKKAEEDDGIGVDSEETKILSDNTANPYAISYRKKEKKDVKPGITGVAFNPKTDTAMNMCISATGSLENGEQSCDLFKNLNNELHKDCSVWLYCRTLDKHHVSMLSDTVIDGCNSKTWATLKNDRMIRDFAIKYQKRYKECRGFIKFALRIAVSSGEKLAESAPSNMANNIISKLENYLETDFFGQYTDDICDIAGMPCKTEEEIKKKMETLEAVNKEALGRMNEAIISLFGESTKNLRNILQVCKAKAYLRKALYKAG